MSPTNISKYEVRSMNDEIQMFAPTGDEIKGTLETVQPAARASFHDGGNEFRHTGSRPDFHDSMMTKCIDGVPLFVDSSRAERSSERGVGKERGRPGRYRWGTNQ